MDVDIDNISTGVAPVSTRTTATLQDFDGGGSQYKACTYSAAPAPNSTAWPSG